MSYNYDKNVQGVDSDYDVKSDKRTKRFIESIENYKNPKVLEIGVGQGRYIKKILRFRQDLTIYGVDISSKAIKEIKKSGPKGNYFVAGVEKLPFSKNFFDVVVIADVLEHLPDPEIALSEIYRVLKPSGIFHFYVPCEGEPYTLDWLLRRLNIARNLTQIHFGHIQYFSHKVIRKLVNKKFKIIKESYSDHLLTQILYFLVLYLPKIVIDLLAKDKKNLLRDASIKDKKQSGSGLRLIKKLWVMLITYPASVIAELETSILKGVSFNAKGIHVTAVKRTLPVK